MVLCWGPFHEAEESICENLALLVEDGTELLLLNLLEEKQRFALRRDLREQQQRLVARALTRRQTLGEADASAAAA